MIKCRRIELLAPARNLECGIEAIKHGADAVYIGAPKFGARAAAGNSLDDLQQLVDFAHLYRVRIYVTINTILKDEELKETCDLIWDLYQIGVDALIVQDLALLRMPLPPIPLHSSTQMDNRTPEKVALLHSLGYRQAVLARELTLQEIRDIHEKVPQMPLEVFVHGALCVSYSGQCYASQACFGRSANRGECAQFCRLPFDMVDAEGKTVFSDRYPLSLKDLNQSEQLEQLLDAGVSSLKIEGRLKDVSYVKNVTAYYRQQLDEIFSRRPEFRQSSSGEMELNFHPQLSKSFNRGFTHYFLNGRQKDICSFVSPKSMGEEMGYVKEQRGGSIIMAGTRHFNNGDGVCYVDDRGRLSGFRINRVDQNKLYPQERNIQLRPRTVLYRNYDQEFEKMISRPSAERKIRLSMVFSELPDGFLLRVFDEDDCGISLPVRREKEEARKPQEENIKTQLAKLGNTPFVVESIEVQLSKNYFLPSSVLAELRRLAVEKMMTARKISYPREIVRPVSLTPTDYFAGKNLTYLANCFNEESRRKYKELGAANVDDAFESAPVAGCALMYCRHCIRFMMGWCPTHQQKKSPFREPYYLASKDGRRFRLEFDCRNCQMKVYEAK